MSRSMLAMLPSARNVQMLPDKIISEGLDFHFPGEYNVLVPVNFDDVDKLHRQLVCWCLTQRYWYYVLHNPQVSDGEYDGIEQEIAELESDCEYLITKYSPTVKAGSSRKEDYPAYLRWIFRNEARK